ncbi:MAG: sugar-binding protein [Planctomycetota bacterium]
MELVPTRFLFDFEIPLRYRARVPRLTGELAGWSEEFLLPPLGRLEGLEPFAPVYVCWNETGLFVATEVRNKSQPLRCEPERYWKSDALRLCTDTRNTRTSRRASRYCQQFYLMPTGGGSKGDQPAAASVKIKLAREDAPSVAPGVVHVVAQVARDGYRLEAHIPAKALWGFDPDEHNRIGFYYILEDHDHGQQYLTVGDDLQWYVDPSTWATAVLVR